MNRSRLVVPPGARVRLKDYDPAATGEFRGKEDARQKLEKDIERLARYQDVLYAQGTHAVLIILQAMDAAGKDGAIKHVMSGVNPQGCEVVSFKVPSAEELRHTYLWRYHKAVPGRGRIGIFNRSYYEEVLVVRVHPELLARQALPNGEPGKKFWERRFLEINDFERHLVHNGVVVLKFFLNVSKDEQRRRLLERIDAPEKNWKFAPGDLSERSRWEEYMGAYEEVFRHTSTAWAPWHIIPADHKWFTRTAVAGLIVETLRRLKLRYPGLGRDQRSALAKARRLLERGGSDA